MPTYHFNVYDGVSLPDPDGHRLPDIATAKREAVVLAGSLIRENPGDFWGGQEWRMEVTDERGLILFTLMFVGNLAPALYQNAPPEAHRLQG